MSNILGELGVAYLTRNADDMARRNPQRLIEVLRDGSWPHDAVSAEAFELLRQYDAKRAQALVYELWADELNIVWLIAQGHPMGESLQVPEMMHLGLATLRRIFEDGRWAPGLETLVRQEAILANKLMQYTLEVRAQRAYERLTIILSEWVPRLGYYTDAEMASHNYQVLMHMHLERALEKGDPDFAHIVKGAERSLEC